MTHSSDSPAGAEAMALIYSLSPLGLMLSSHRNIVHCNERFASLFGYSVTELIGANLAFLYPSKDEYLRIGDRGHKVMSAKGEYRDERLMRQRDGALKWFRVSGRTNNPSQPFETASWVFEPLASGAEADRLTPREREVLSGMARGHTSKEAARELGLSPRTIEKLRAGLRLKFGVKNATELMSRIGGFPH